MYFEAYKIARIGEWAKRPLFRGGVRALGGDRAFQALFGELQRIQNGKGDPGKVVELCKQVDLQAGARRRADDNEKERMTRGFLCIDGWAGRREIPCEVLNEMDDKVGIASIRA
jgi:hypothetical protein